MDRTLLRRIENQWEYLYFIPEAYHHILGKENITVVFTDHSYNKTSIQVFRHGKLKLERKSILRQEVKQFLRLLHSFKFTQELMD